MRFPPTIDLWPHFLPLWTQLNQIAPNFLIAGGYGLFLKQRWLKTAPVQVLVPIERWNAPEPRATKDLDVIVELNIIASPENQQQIHEILEAQEYQVVPGNERWQFVKPIAPDQSVILDFHSPKPGPERSDLRAKGRRVKPKLSLKQTGIHGHENFEAVGCELHPLTFTIDDIQITVPNSVTWVTMKMVAMRDRLQKSRDPEQMEGNLRDEESEARKHTEDVYRILAMMTRDEADQASEIVAAIHTTKAYQDACAIYREFFAAADSWGPHNVAAQWAPDDFTQMQTVLTTWFSLNSDAIEHSH
ncbi:MAG: hypothetical protein ABI210_07005 [Abditibacteriaceae bacterium]